MKRTISLYKLHSGSIHGENGGQARKKVRFCPECHCYGNSAHAASCKSTSIVYIPCTAQLPRKGASKRIWQLFVLKFVERVAIKSRILENQKQKNNGGKANYEGYKKRLQSDNRELECQAKMKNYLTAKIG